MPPTAFMELLVQSKKIQNLSTLQDFFKIQQSPDIKKFKSALGVKGNDANSSLTKLVMKNNGGNESPTIIRRS